MVKFNGGKGALICDECRMIIAEPYGLKLQHSEVALCNKCGRRYQELIGLVRDLLKILDTVEETDEGREFHPTVISSCRVMHCEKADKILHRMGRIINKKSTARPAEEAEHKCGTCRHRQKSFSYEPCRMCEKGGFIGVKQTDKWEEARE